MNEVYTFEYKGCVLKQTSYNWHFTINGRMHVNCCHKLTEKEAMEAIDLYLEMQYEMARMEYGL